MSDQTPTAVTKKPRGRSPSYPAINLETAIDRVKVLYAKERQHPTPAETIVRHWGYKSFNGPASLSLAALKKFGLTVDEGTTAARRAAVSDLAVNILENPDPAKRRAAIQEAALRPTIHAELWHKYEANLPSDESLRWELTRERGFTPTGADEFIPEYRATISFAQLTSGATVATQIPEVLQDDDGDDEVPNDPPPPPPGRRRAQLRTRQMSGESTAYAVPVAAGSDIVIEGHFPLSEAEWAQFMAVLDVMKRGLVAEPADEDD